MRWSTEQYREYQSRQLPLGKVVGLDKTKRINSSLLEWQESERLIRWRNEEGVKLFPDLAFLHAIPNGGFRHKVVAAKMQAQGVMPGVPDFYLDVARSGYHGLRIELKRLVGGTVSEKQRRWIDWLNSQGYLAVVCRGCAEAREVLVDYLSGKLNNADAN